MFFDSAIATDANGSGVGQVLRQEVTSNQVLIVSFISGFSLGICRLVLVLGLRTRLGSIKVTPVMCGLHHLPEAYGEDRPVGTIGLKARDVGGELFNGRGRSRHCRGDRSGSSRIGR
jgi:hypothetical protein